MAEPLSVIINDSFTSGIFPDLLKRAIVVPIHKSGSKCHSNNYRPICVLPLVSKIFEKCFSARLVNYLSGFNIISSQQFGFQKSICTADAILDFVEFAYTALNQKEHSFGIFIDMRKAFDTVSHDILLKKLYKYGIRGAPHKWLASYLHNRTQRVKVGTALSGARLVTCGVPQGSVLGPLLFLLYVNDMTNVFDGAHFTLFADDTTVACSDASYSTLIENANLGLSKLYDWTVNNRLSLNESKTAAILLSNRKHAVEVPSILCINGVQIDFVGSARFLGIELDTNLTFKYHVQHICSKLSKTTGILYRICKFIPQDALIKLYYEIIYPYCYMELLYGVVPIIATCIP